MLQNFLAKITPPNQWYKNRTFLIFFVVQIIAVYAIASWHFEPIWRITFTNGEKEFHGWMNVILNIALLLPFWVLQVLALSLYRTSMRNQYIITLGSYVYGLGGAVPLAIEASGRSMPEKNTTFWKIIKALFFFVLIYILLRVCILLVARGAVALIFAFAK